MSEEATRFRCWKGHPFLEKAHPESA